LSPIRGSGTAFSTKRNLFLHAHGKRQWIDEFPFVADPASPRPASPNGDAAPNDPGRVSAGQKALARITQGAELKENDELWLSELSRVGWSVSLGMPRSVLITPSASYSVSAPLIHKGMRVFLLKDMVLLKRPDLKRWGVWAFGVISSAQLTSIIFFNIYWDRASGSPEEWAGVSALLLGMTFLWLWIIKLQTDNRNWRNRRDQKAAKHGRKKCCLRIAPSPLWPTGKFEYGFLNIWLFSLISYFQNEQSSMEFEMPFNQVCMIFQYLMFSAFFFHEGILGLINAVKGVRFSSRRECNLWGAFELCERKTHAQMRTIIA